MGSARRPASDVEDRPDLLRPLLHVEQPEVTAFLGGRTCVRGDARPGIVDR
jgi:hypothetical protein